MPTLTVNSRSREVSFPGSRPLLWVIRETFGLTGTKYGCGIGQCGACTVLVDGNAMRSCQLTLADAEGREITTIEGLSPDGAHVVQRAWVEEQVPQCGYCQSGQILSAVALLRTTARPTDDDIDGAMSGNICRCGAYGAIRRAIHRAAELGDEPTLATRRTATEEQGGGDGGGA